MKPASTPIIFLLVLALLIQNTCLHGFAGKTALAPTCGHCPQKQVVVAAQGGQKFLSAHHHNPVQSPMFVFAVPDTTPVFNPEPTKTARPILVNGYKDALPDELLRPPSA